MTVLFFDVCGPKFAKLWDVIEERSVAVSNIGLAVKMFYVFISFSQKRVLRFFILPTFF